MIKILVSTHSGDADELTVEAFDPVEINEQINNNDVQSVLIADHIYSRIDIKNIKPIAEPEEDGRDHEIDIPNNTHSENVTIPDETE